MAVTNLTISAFCLSLSPAQRNHLRIILHLESASEALRHELGVNSPTVVREHDRRTGLARQGRTAELFGRVNRHAANLKADHER